MSAMPPPKAEDALVMRLEGGPEAAARARRGLSALGARLDPARTDALRLLVTELVGNSVRHARAEVVELKVRIEGQTLRTEVCDDGPGFDAASLAGPREDQTGWGLYMVDRLADHWGVERENGSTRVWFELPA